MYLGVGSSVWVSVLSLNIQLLHLDQVRIPMYRRAAHWVAPGGLRVRPWRGGNRKDRLAYPVSVGKNLSLLHDSSVPNHSNLHITNSLSTTNTARIVAA